MADLAKLADHSKICCATLFQIVTEAQIQALIALVFLGGVK